MFLYYNIVCKKIERACNSMVSNHRLGAFRLPCAIDQLKINDWFFCSWTVGLGTPQLVGESLQIAPLKLKNGNPIVATTEECFCPFDLSSQQESAVRKNLDLRLSEDWEKRSEDMASNLINLVDGDSEKYLTEKLEAEEIQQRFKRSLHNNREYSPIYVWRYRPRVRAVQDIGINRNICWSRLPHMLGVPLKQSY